MSYSIWIEFEEYENTSDSTDEYCNIAVIFDDGARQVYNVWTIKYFQERLNSLLDEIGEEGFSINIPDLIVTKLSREHITEVMTHIVPKE